MRHRLYVVPVLMSSLDILECLSRTEVPLKMNEISEATGVPLTTTYRILQTLVHRGYLAHNPEGKYSLANPDEMRPAFRKRGHANDAEASGAKARPVP
jgi:Mn-dependent DtxR family transcriptional regulator